MAVSLLFAAPGVAEGVVKNGWHVCGQFGQRCLYQNGKPTGHTMTEQQFLKYVDRVAGYSQGAGGGAQTRGSATATQQAQQLLKQCQSPVAGRCARIRGQAASLLQKAGRFSFSALPRLTVGGSAFYVGWKLGDWFMGITGNDGNKAGSGIYPVTERDPVDEGIVVISQVHSEELFGETVVDCHNHRQVSTTHRCEAITPAAGWVALADGAPSNGRREQAASEPGVCDFRFADVPGEFVSLPASLEKPTSGTCAQNNNTLAQRAYFAPIMLEELLEEYDEQEHGQADVSTAGGPADASDEDAGDAALWCLTTAACLDFADWWLNNDDELAQEIGEENVPPDPLYDWVILPDLRGMPYQDAIAEIENELGLDATPQENTEAHPAYGPNEVTATNPAHGTRLRRGEDHVTVLHNPATAPTSPGGWTPPNIRDIDLSPITNLALNCNVFPFGVFCWTWEALGGWGNEGGCDQIVVPFTTAELPFDFCQFEPAMQIIRPVLLVVVLLGLGYLLAASAMGFGGGTNSDD